MAPPTGPLNLDVEAISGICGSISIACWVVVFSPQIIENFRRGNADGLSLQFIIVWLAGDVFNILGAVLQGVLPTMIILAVYYTIADIVLLGQCFYYRGFTWRDEVAPPPTPKPRRSVKPTISADDDTVVASANERTALLAKPGQSQSQHQHHHSEHERRGSNWSALSPAVPFVHVNDIEPDSSLATSSTSAAASQAQAQTSSAATAASRPRTSVTVSRLQTAAFNVVAMLMVCAAGVAGWYLSGGSRKNDGDHQDQDRNNGEDDLQFSVWGQVFGYLCAVLYLGSRLPQLLLNWRRQSTDGVSMLFFLFACLGNLTYVLSIFAYEGCTSSDGGGDNDDLVCTPGEARRLYGRYLLVNLSWLAGSLGTLLLDMGIFIQFFLYRTIDEDEEEGDAYYSSNNTTTAADDDDDDDRTNVERERDQDSDDEPYDDPRPILQRNMSNFDD